MKLASNSKLALRLNSLSIFAVNGKQGLQLQPHHSPLNLTPFPNSTWGWTWGGADAQIWGDDC